MRAQEILDVHYAIISLLAACIISRALFIDMHNEGELQSNDRCIFIVSYRWSIIRKNFKISTKITIETIFMGPS